MWIGHWSSSIGLVLGMIGVLILFRWGPPQPAFKESVGRAVEVGTILKDGTKAADIVDGEQREKRKFQRMSGVGLGLVGVGFALQLIGVWVSP